MSYRVLIPQDVAEKGKQFLREHGYEIKMGTGMDVETIRKEVVDCDAILARISSFPAEVIRAGKNLKVIARHGVGVDNIDVEEATRRGVYVTNAPESNAVTVAEHTMGLIVALAKNTVRCDGELRNGNFEIRNQIKGVDLEGKILGIIGMGRIGSIVARKAALGFDMKIQGFDPYIPADRDIPHARLVADLDRLLQDADFITLHVPATEETRGMIAARELELIKPSAYLVNAARGGLVDEKALAKALETKQIAGAALDVFEVEPPPVNHPLYKFPNVVISPHSAALTVECTDRMSLHAAMGIHEVLTGRTPSWPVNNPRKHD